MPVPPTRILLADDQADVLEALRLLLKPAGYEVVTASSPGGHPGGARRARSWTPC